MPNCVGIVDGTPINFEWRPNIDGEVYWSRKSRYCINLQLVCDDRRNIRFVQAGWPGSVFDSTVFDNSDICKNPSLFFSAGEFIIADAGYALKPFICTPYKHPLADIPHNRLFNELFSSARCVIEHVNGMLKGRFNSLKGVRILVCKLSDFKRMNEWITVCCVLHNILNYQKDCWDEEYTEENNTTDEESQNYQNENRFMNLRVQVQNNVNRLYF